MDLHKHTVNELLNMEDGKVQNRSEDVIYKVFSPPESVELITDTEDRANFTPHNWTALGGSTMSVFRNDLKFITGAVGNNVGVELDVAYIKGLDGTNGIQANQKYYLELTLDTVAGDTTPRINISLGGQHEKVYALDGDPNDGTINTTNQLYYANVTTDNSTGALQVYQTSADNTASGTTTVLIENITLTMEGGTTNTQHLDVSGHKNIAMYVNYEKLYYSFSTTPKDISGVRGAHASGWGLQMITNTDFESSTGNWALKYEGGSGSEATLTKNNTSSPLSGSKDMKMDNASNEIAGAVSDSLTGAGRQFFPNSRYKLTFKYLTNYDGENQPNPMMVRLITDDQEGSYSEPLSPIVANTAAPELLINGNFKDSGDDADVLGSEMLGWRVVDQNPDENTISRASDQVTFTAGLGGGSDDLLYIVSVDADGNYNRPFDEGETYLVRVDVESISGLSPIFEPAGGPAFKTLVAGINEFLWIAPGNGPIDESTGKGTDSVVIRKQSGQTGNFVLNRVSITKHSVDNKPYNLDLTATTATNVTMYFESGNPTSGSEYLVFAIGNDGSTNGIFQVDDINLYRVNDASLEYSSNDLSTLIRGTQIIPVPDLGETIYFNYVNNLAAINTQVVIEKL